MASSELITGVIPTWQAVLLEAAERLREVRFYQLDMRVLVALNTLLLPSTNPYRGVLRDGPVVIRLGSELYRPTSSAEQSRAMVASTLKWLGANLQDGSASPAPVALAREAMLQLTEAHPFVDGNGRVARAVATWLLLRSGYELRADPREYTRARKVAYYRALATGQGLAGPRDIMPWNAFFDGLAAECYEAPHHPRG